MEYENNKFNSSIQQKLFFIERKYNEVNYIFIFSFPQRPVVNTILYSAHANGVLATGSAQARTSAWPPIDTSGNLLAHMSGGGNILAKSENSKHF